MQALKIKKQIDSDILYLPELKNLIGKNAEIVILTESDEQFFSGIREADKKPGAEKGERAEAFSASALLKYAESWRGNDLEQCLEELYSVRGEAAF